MFKQLKKKVKLRIFGILEKVANKIHPKNSSGNNQSRM